MTAPTPADDPQAPPPASGMTAAQLAALLALVQAQAALRQQIVDTAVAAIVNPLRVLGSDVWWNDAAYRKVVTSALKIVQPAQRNVARQTDAYVTRAVKTMTGRTVQAAGAVDVTKLRRQLTERVAQDLVDGLLEPGFVLLGDTHDGPGEDIDAPMELANDVDKWVDPVEPYERIAESYRYEVIAEGKPEVDAREQALVRLATVTETDITLAVRAQYHKSLGKVNAHGWRRILHPELAKSGHSCALCVVAADRIYRIQELKPLHSRCNCEILPILVQNGQRLDPGITLNWRDLQDLYDAAGGTGKDVLGSDGQMHSGGLKKIRVALAEHGELGPVLVNADHKFRGVKKVAETKADRPTQIRHQLDQLLKQHEITRFRAERGEGGDKALRWQADRISQLQRELATT